MLVICNCLIIDLRDFLLCSYFKPVFLICREGMSLVASLLTQNFQATRQ
uniref:Uncharacterized protein n=1 Tax=Arundo donax TaxID=35708 RepID=A0A0A9EMN4_ARUDO